MKKNVIAIIGLIVLTVCYTFFYKDNNEQKIDAHKANTVKFIEQSNIFVEKKNTFTYNNEKIQYLLIFPAKYTQTSNDWPMILFLHGSSLRGNNLDKVKEYGPTWVSEQRNDFPFIVLAPQCPENEDWETKPDILAALLDDVLKRYRIDQDKVYVTGTSMGGRGTWVLACKYPEYFAAIAPLATATFTPPSTWKPKMISMPIWAFHGEKDTVAPLKNDEVLINALCAQGNRPKLTILPNQGHYIAGIYKNKNLYDWFLSNTRKN